MFARVIDDLKESAGHAVKMTSLAAAIAITFFITLCFLCADLLVYVSQNYGPVAACLLGAAIFLAIALTCLVVYAGWKRQARRQAAEAHAKSVLQTALRDPALVATGIQLVRAIGVKKLVPILAVGGLALGLLANRAAHSDQAPAE